MSKRETDKGLGLECCSQKMNVTVITLMVVALVQSVALVSVTLYWSRVRGDRLRPREPEIHAATHALFSRDVDVIPKEFEKFSLDNNGTEYVGSAGDMLTALSHLAVANHYNGDATPETMDFKYNLPKECKAMTERSWIKMTLPWKLEADSKLNASKVFWNPKSEGTRSNSLLSYNNDTGAVVINKDGNYFVTSQIVAECPEEQENVMRIDNPLRIHIILSSSESGISSCVLQNARSKCDKVAENSLVSSSIGAVFKLRKQDRLFVAISNQNKTELEDKSNNYFAVYAL